MIRYLIWPRTVIFSVTESKFQNSFNPEPSFACLHVVNDACHRNALFAVVICPGGPSSYHIVDAPVLDALGPNGFLVNVARGSIVDEASLLERLHDRRLGGAALDVFEEEPKMYSVQFCGHANCAHFICSCQRNVQECAVSLPRQRVAFTAHWQRVKRNSRWYG